jgi:hypothetical protein
VKKLNQDEFKDKCREVHVDKYDYSQFDGIQHFKPIKDFGGEEEFEIIKKRDRK